jgi:hypothetical protein
MKAKEFANDFISKRKQLANAKVCHFIIITFKTIELFF